MKQNLYTIEAMKFYYKLFFVAVVCFCYNSCKNETVQIEKTRLIPFSQSNEVDEKGVVKDSTVNYFPECIFIDTVDYFVGENGQLFNALHISKNRYSKISSTPIEELRDTSIIMIDTTTMRFALESYLLYKMQEPSLSNRYLDKDIYRIVSLRSFHSPVVIRIEKSKNKVQVISKELNRHITYPFYKYSDKVIVFTPPVIKGVKTVEFSYEEQYAKAKAHTDSMVAKYNNTNYFLTTNDLKELPFSAWRDIEAMVDSSNFWKSKPMLYLNHVQLDGSMWILEGHTREGYQIRRIPSPFNYNNCSYNRQNDDNKANYARVFQKIIEYSNFTDFKFY